MIEEDEDDIEDVRVEMTTIVDAFLAHLKLQEEWSDTEWLPEDFKDS